MIPLDFAVALRVVKTCAYVLHTIQTHKVLEVLGDEQGTVVRDDWRFDTWKLLASRLENNLNVDLLHFFANSQLFRRVSRGEPAYSSVPSQVRFRVPQVLFLIRRAPGAVQRSLHFRTETY